jgi:hypothetical protein
MPPKSKNTQSYRSARKEKEEQLQKWRDYHKKQLPLMTDEQREKKRARDRKSYWKKKEEAKAKEEERKRELNRNRLRRFRAKVRY